MPTDHRARLAGIRRFDQLVAYLRDEMGWPIARDSFEDVDDLFYDFTADELGIWGSLNNPGFKPVEFDGFGAPPRRRPTA